MAQTRIAFVDMPRMLREIVKEVVSSQSDMAVVGDFADPLPLVKAVEASDAEFVIAGADYALAADVGTLLAERPQVKVFAVADDGRETLLWVLEPTAVALGEMSPRTLLAAIRARARGA